MTTYTILTKPGGDAASPPITEEKLLPAVAELSGRNVLSIGSVRRKLRESGSVYIAVNRDSVWATCGFGRGFIVKRVEA